LRVLELVFAAEFDKRDGTADVVCPGSSGLVCRCDGFVKGEEENRHQELVRASQDRILDGVSHLAQCLAIELLSFNPEKSCLKTIAQ